MRNVLLAGIATLMMSGGAMAQIQSPSQTGPGGPPLTSAQPPSNAPAPRGSANSATMTRNSGQAMHSRSGHSSGEVRRARTTRQSRMNESDRAYMGGGMILENGRPVDMPMGSSMGGSSMGGAGMGGSAPGMRGSTMGPDRWAAPQAARLACAAIRAPGPAWAVRWIRPAWAAR
jgi:hypothetical protein